MINEKNPGTFHNQMIVIPKRITLDKLMNTPVDEHEKSRCGFPQQLKNLNYRY